jgi:purine-nucleoside phosphorylase
MPLSSSPNVRSVGKAADRISSIMVPPFRFAVLTGTGSGDSLSSLQVDGAMDYRDIPNFPVSTVPSHHGRLSAGRIAGQTILLFQGRFHLYEGYTPQEVTFPIRVMQALGVKVLIMTNAAGGLNPLFSAGDIMIIEDHINLTGANPLVGPNHDPWGARFPELIHAYDGRLQEIAQSAAQQLEVGVQKGVYAGLLGPSLETPAEMRFLRRAGAEAVGFSTVMETIAAVHAGLQVLALSVITNMCLPEAPTSSSVEDIIAVAQGAAPHLETMITHVIERWDAAGDGEGDE